MDFSFVRHICQDFYVDWGRDAWDPVLMFKMVFLQFLYDLSARMENPLNVTVSNYWSRHGDLNPRPADYESAALPLSYAGLGFSLAASCLLRNAHLRMPDGLPPMPPASHYRYYIDPLRHLRGYPILPFLVSKRIIDQTNGNYQERNIVRYAEDFITGAASTD